MDSGMVDIRGEGWKEVKVGTVFDIEQRLERDPRSGELVEQPHGVRMAYTAVLGSADQFEAGLWGSARARGVPTAATAFYSHDDAAAQRCFGGAAQTSTRVRSTRSPCAWMQQV